MGYTYILLLNNGKYYIGSTREIEKRVQKHENGGVPSTKNYRPIKLLHYNKYESYSEARKCEIKLKRMKSRYYTEKFISGLIV